MQQSWQLQEAKNHFSEVVEKALQDVPQFVTRRGVEAVVVLSVERYRQLTKPRGKLVEFFRSSPLCGIDLSIERGKEPSREVEL